MQHVRGLLLCSLITTCAMANVAVTYPGDINVVQPDGTLVNLRLKGHPYTGVFETDSHGHPVVRDDEGWFVYASHHNTSLAHNGRRRLQPSADRVGIDDPPSQPAPDLTALAHDIPPLDADAIMKMSRSDIPPADGHLGSQLEIQSQLNDLLCAGMDRSQWCPNNKVDISKLGRSNTIDGAALGGVLNIIVVLVMFSDQADRPVAERPNFDILFNGDGFDPEITPTGSVKRFFEIQSAGKMHVNAQVEDWVVVDNTEEYYGFGRNGLTWMIASIADRTLDRMDARGTDWSQFDRDEVSLDRCSRHRS